MTKVVDFPRRWLLQNRYINFKSEAELEVFVAFNSELLRVDIEEIVESFLPQRVSIEISHQKSSVMHFSVKDENGFVIAVIPLYREDYIDCNVFEAAKRQ